MKPGADSSEQSLEYAEGRKERGRLVSQSITAVLPEVFFF